MRKVEKKISIAYSETISALFQFAVGNRFRHTILVFCFSSSQMFSVVAVHATCANTPLFHLFWDGNKIDFLILIKTTGPVFLDTCIQLEHKEGRGVCGPSVFLICCFYLRLIFFPKPAAHLSSDGEQTAVPLEHSFRLFFSQCSTST